MKLKEKIQRTKQILKSTPKCAGQLIDGTNYFPTFIIRHDGTVLYLLKPRMEEGLPWYMKFLEHKASK